MNYLRNLSVLRSGDKKLHRVKIEMKLFIKNIFIFIWFKTFILNNDIKSIFILKAVFIKAFLMKLFSLGQK